MLYDPSYSEKGVLLCAGRAPRAANPLDFEVRTWQIDKARHLDFGSPRSSICCSYFIYRPSFGGTLKCRSLTLELCVWSVDVLEPPYAEPGSEP